MPEGEEIDAVTGAAVEPTPESDDKELEELNELVDKHMASESSFWNKLKGYPPEKLDKLFEIGARQRPDIKTLCTQFCELDTAGFLKMAYYLPKFQNLMAIYLDGCKIGDDGIAALCPAVQPTIIKRLWLSECGISDAGAEMLAESMPKWPTFLYLQLSGNTAIGDVGACALFRQIYMGPLSQLYMHRTNLTVVSAAALLDAQLECQTKKCIEIIIPLDPEAISKTSWRKHGWIPNKELFAAAYKREGSWDYERVQHKMLELREKKVRLKTSEECCVLQ